MEMVKRHSLFAIFLICASIIINVNASSVCKCPQSAISNNAHLRVRKHRIANDAIVQKLISAPAPASVPVPAQNASTSVSEPSQGEGQKWCVPKLGKKKTALMKIIVDGCKLPGIDCSPLDELHGACHHPNNPHKHATFVMNAIYRSKGKADSACDFGGIGKITTVDPSHDTCIIPGN